MVVWNALVLPLWKNLAIVMSVQLPHLSIANGALGWKALVQNLVD